MELLKKLTAAFGPSGREENIKNIIVKPNTNPKEFN